MNEKKKAVSQEINGLDDQRNKLPECFVIMPISDQTGYESGHFLKVYEDVFKPACLAAGYMATRADDVKQSNLIHLDILKRVVHSPMAICDLSSRNPNVLFELGLRQAFDKPTILVKDEETPDIFDIAPIRYTNYRRSLRYREVLFDQDAIAEAIRTTRDTTGQSHNVNSLIRLLELAAPAKIAEGGTKDPNEYLQILMAEVSQLRKEVRASVSLDGSITLPPVVREPNSAKKPIANRASLVDRMVKRLLQQIEAGTPRDELQEEINHTLQRAEEAIDFYRAREPADAGVNLRSVMENFTLLRSLLV